VTTVRPSHTSEGRVQGQSLDTSFAAVAQSQQFCNSLSTGAAA